MALAILFPPLGVLVCGKFGQFLLNIFFCIIGVWIGGIIHAVYVVMKHDQDQRHLVAKYDQDRRHREMIQALIGAVQQPPATPVVRQPSAPPAEQRPPVPPSVVQKGGPTSAAIIVVSCVLAVAFWLLLLSVIIGSVDSPVSGLEQNSEDAAIPVVEKAEVEASSSDPTPKALNELYSIISDEAQGKIKRTVEVRLQEKVSEETIREIANMIRAADSRSFHRTFIGYYLPGQPVGEGSWATSNFDPRLDIKIWGLPKDSEELVSKAAKLSETEIGRWDFASYLIILLRNENKIMVRRIHADGSFGDVEVSAYSVGSEVILKRMEADGYGGFWILDSDSNLREMDKEGFIRKAVNSRGVAGISEFRERFGATAKPTEKISTIFDFRTWTSADGLKTFNGRLTKIGDRQVTVEKDGIEVTFLIVKLADADKRFLGQGVTITTVDGAIHEKGSVTEILADSIMFKTASGVASIPVENLPETMRRHFGYNPSKAP